MIKRLRVLFNYAMSVGVRDDFDVFFNRMGLIMFSAFPTGHLQHILVLITLHIMLLCIILNIVPGPKDSNHCVWPVRGGK